MEGNIGNFKVKLLLEFLLMINEHVTETLAIQLWWLCIATHIATTTRSQLYTVSVYYCIVQTIFFEVV